MSDQKHSTTQAHEEPNPGPKPDEHPADMASRPNDPHSTRDAKPNEQHTDADYPEQKHAGKVGLGPHYAEQNQPTAGDVMGGWKKELKGKVTHNENMVHEGHDDTTGETKRRLKEQEKNEKNPFQKPSIQEGAQNSGDKEKAEGQDEGTPKDTPK